MTQDHPATDELRVAKEQAGNISPVSTGEPPFQVGDPVRLHRNCRPDAASANFFGVVQECYLKRHSTGMIWHVRALWPQDPIPTDSVHYVLEIAPIRAKLDAPYLSPQTLCAIRTIHSLSNNHRWASVLGKIPERLLSALEDRGYIDRLRPDAARLTSAGAQAMMTHEGIGR